MSVLAQSIIEKTGQDRLAFFDAIAPIIHFDSINMDIAWFQSRWDKGEGKDYINCPLDEEQYSFHQGLIDSEKSEFKEWEENTSFKIRCIFFPFLEFSFFAIDQSLTEKRDIVLHQAGS